MLHALHGNAGLPGDLAPWLTEFGWPFECWHLWKFLDEHPDARTLTGFAAAFQRAVDARGESGPRILLGYSLGARLALHVLAAAPAKWDAAILLSPHPGLTTSTEREERVRTDLNWAARFMRDDWSEVMQAWNAQPTLAGESVPQYDQRLVETWRREVALGFQGWSLAEQEDLRPQFPRIPCPVLWLTGLRDRKFTALAGEASPLLPRSEHHAIFGAGHRVHLDQPAAVAEKIQTFVQSLHIS
jgi:2-succinyl-6-hydroxy-2,4-cyclohexadiene-1-carboxylate synthase